MFSREAGWISPDVCFILPYFVYLWRTLPPSLKQCCGALFTENSSFIHFWIFLEFEVLVKCLSAAELSSPSSASVSAALLSNILLLLPVSSRVRTFRQKEWKWVWGHGCFIMQLWASFSPHHVKTNDHQIPPLAFWCRLYSSSLTRAEMSLLKLETGTRNKIWCWWTSAGRCFTVFWQQRGNVRVAVSQNLEICQNK